MGQRRRGGNVALGRYGGSILSKLTWELESEGHDALHLDDMGDECLVLSQMNDAGDMERVAVSLEQLQEAVAVLGPRYRGTKNTDRQPLITATM